MTPAQRSLRAKVASNTRWANTSAADRITVSTPGREAAEARFDRMVIEKHGVLDPEEHAKYVAAYRAAFYASIQLKSAKTRAANAAARRKK